MPHSTVSNSLVHTIVSKMNEEDELKRDIQHLERRLAIAKQQLVFITYQKHKQLKS